MASYNKLIVQIYGGRYPIKTPEDPAYVANLAHELDGLIRDMMTANQSLSLNEALVLAALHYMDAYQKSEKGTDNLRGQITEYLEDAAKARLEAGEARREITRLEQQLSFKGNKN